MSVGLQARFVGPRGRDVSVLTLPVSLVSGHVVSGHVTNVGTESDAALYTTRRR